MSNCTNHMIIMTQVTAIIDADMGKYTVSQSSRLVHVLTCCMKQQSACSFATLCSLLQLAF